MNELTIEKSSLSAECVMLKRKAHSLMLENALTRHLPVPDRFGNFLLEISQVDPDLCLWMVNLHVGFQYW